MKMKRSYWGLLFIAMTTAVVFTSCKQGPPTKKALVTDVENYITGQQKKNDGFFLVYDSVAKKHLKLKLDSVHTDKFSLLADGDYFDCAQFTGENGKSYDIDIFMKWNGRKFEPTSKRMVHKVNDKPRYVWYKDDSIWKTKKPTKKTKMKDGHPAH